MSVSADYASPCSCDVSPCLASRSHCEPPARMVKRLVLNERFVQQPPSIWLMLWLTSLHRIDMNPFSVCQLSPSNVCGTEPMLSQREMNSIVTPFPFPESREFDPLSPGHPIASNVSIWDLHLTSSLAMRDRLITTLSLRSYLILSYWLDCFFTWSNQPWSLHSSRKTRPSLITKISLLLGILVFTASLCKPRFTELLLLSSSKIRRCTHFLQPSQFEFEL